MGIHPVTSSVGVVTRLGRVQRGGQSWSEVGRGEDRWGWRESSVYGGSKGGEIGKEILMPGN